MQEIVQKVRERLKESGWEEVLYTFLSSSSFEEIFIELVKIKEEEKKRFVPRIQDVFRYLEECPWEKVKAVMMVDQVYTTLNMGDGIPYSCSRIKKSSYLLTSVTEPLVRRDKSYKIPIDLTEWTNQGLLLLPIAPTAYKEGKTHKKIWNPFTCYIIDKINHEKKNIPWVLINKSAHRMEDLIKSPHQLKASMIAYKPFEDNGCYDFINDVLKRQGKEPVKW